MHNHLVADPAVHNPIHPTLCTRTRELGDFNLDIAEFQCNACNFLRFTYPTTHPSKVSVSSKVLESLEDQLRNKPAVWGKNRTLVCSMIADGFCPNFLKSEITERVLETVLDRTSFVIRILTKRAAVGSDKFIRLFTRYPGRFVVGLSLCTPDDKYFERREPGASKPSARIQALHNLQEAQIPSYGMINEADKHLLSRRRLERLVERIRPSLVEGIWVEAADPPFSIGQFRMVKAHEWHNYGGLTKFLKVWSSCQAKIYLKLKKKAELEGWLPKLRFILTEDFITPKDALEFKGLHGVYLQGESDKEGISMNPGFAEYQQGKDETGTYLVH